MTPKITRQTKLLIKDKHLDSSSPNATKFTAMDPVPTVSFYLLKENKEHKKLEHIARNLHLYCECRMNWRNGKKILLLGK